MTGLNVMCPPLDDCLRLDFGILTGKSAMHPMQRSYTCDAFLGYLICSHAE